MSLSLSRVLALAQRVPGIVYVGLFVVTLAAGGLVAIYVKGEHAGARKIVQAARRDSTAQRVVARDSAMRRTDRTVVVATVAKAEADSSRAAVRRQAAVVQRRRREAVVVAALDSAPTVVQQLVDDQAQQIGRDSAQMVRDSSALAASAAALRSAQVERAAHLAVDTARVHEQLAAAPDTGPSVLDIAKDVSLVAVLLGTVVGILSLLHR